MCYQSGGEKCSVCRFFLPYKIERYGCYNDLQAVIFGRGCKTGAAVCTSQTYEQSINVKKKQQKPKHLSIFVVVFSCDAKKHRQLGQRVSHFGFWSLFCSRGLFQSQPKSTNVTFEGSPLRKDRCLDTALFCPLPNMRKVNQGISFSGTLKREDFNRRL